MRGVEEMMILSCVVNKADADEVCICVLLVECWVHLLFGGEYTILFLYGTCTNWISVFIGLIIFE